MYFVKNTIYIYCGRYSPLHPQQLLHENGIAKKYVIADNGTLLQLSLSLLLLVVLLRFGIMTLVTHAIQFKPTLSDMATLKALLFLLKRLVLLASSPSALATTLIGLTLPPGIDWLRQLSP